MIYIIALIIYLIIFLIDKNIKFVTKYPYFTSDKDKCISLIPKKVWSVILWVIVFIIPLINVLIPIIFVVVQSIYLTMDYKIVLKEGKLKSFVDFLNKDL